MTTTDTNTANLRSAARHQALDTVVRRARSRPGSTAGRSLIIIIVPMVLLQSVIAFVFMERHWQTVTQRLSTAVVQDIAAIIDVIETYPQDADFDEIVRIADTNSD